MRPFTARFRVDWVGHITGRGTTIAGEILEGAIRKGDWIVAPTENGSPLGNNMGRLWTRIMRAADKDGDLGEWVPAPKRKGQHGPQPEQRFTPSFSMYVLRHTRGTLMYEATKDLEHTKDAAAESFKRLVA